MACLSLEKAIVGPCGDPIGLLALEGAIAILAVLTVAGEARGHGSGYSKFASKKAGSRTWPSRLGMAVVYLPALLVSSSFLLLKLLRSPALPPSADGRLLLVAAALSVHFLKRFLEVLFLHKYSGFIEVSVSISISVGYASSVAILLYAQQLAIHREAPEVDIKQWGVATFFVGITGNFYHHYLLATLRSDKDPATGQTHYKIPQGGLFTYVVCPHYLFESITFFGIAMMSQTFFALLNAVNTTAYLCARSYRTKNWYLKKVEGFPAQRKPFFPLLF